MTSIWPVTGLYNAKLLLADIELCAPHALTFWSIISFMAYGWVLETVMRTVQGVGWHGDDAVAGQCTRRDRGVDHVRRDWRPCWEHDLIMTCCIVATLRNCSAVWSPPFKVEDHLWRRGRCSRAAAERCIGGIRCQAAFARANSILNESSGQYGPDLIAGRRKSMTAPQPPRQPAAMIYRASHSPESGR